MIFDPSSAGLSEVHRSKFGLVLIAFAFVCLRGEFLLLLDVLRRRENQINDSVHLGEFLRHENTPNLVHHFWIFKFLLQLHQPEQTVNADEPNIPSVTGAANLSFKIAGVAATHDKQDGAVWLLHPLLGDEVSSVAGNFVQINAVGVGCLHFHDKRVPVRRNPEAIEANFTWRSPISALLDAEAQTLSNFVDNILQRKATTLEFVGQTFACVSREKAGRNEREKVAELLGRRSAVSQLAFAREADDLLDMFRANFFLRGFPKLGERHRQLGCYVFGDSLSSLERPRDGNSLLLVALAEQLSPRPAKALARGHQKAVGTPSRNSITNADLTSEPLPHCGLGCYERSAWRGMNQFPHRFSYFQSARLNSRLNPICLYRFVT